MKTFICPRCTPEEPMSEQGREKPWLGLLFLLGIASWGFAPDVVRDLKETIISALLAAAITAVGWFWPHIIERLHWRRLIKIVR